MTSFTLILFVLLGAAHAGGLLVAQPAPGAIAGVVLTRSGKAIPAATIEAIQTSPNTPRKLYGHGGGGKLILTARGDANGAFRIGDVPPGTYELCVHTAQAMFVNPCEWGRPQQVFVDEGTGTGAEVRLDETSVITLEIDDEDDQFVTAKDHAAGKAAKRSMAVAVVTEGNGLRMAQLVARPRNGAALRTQSAARPRGEVHDHGRGR